MFYSILITQQVLFQFFLIIHCVTAKLEIFSCKVYDLIHQKGESNVLNS